MSYKNELGHYIQKNAHLITIIANERLDKVGLTLSQMRMLRCLWESDGLIQKEIQEKLLIKPSSVNGLLEQLLKKGLVIKEVDANDARKARLYLTEQGKALEEKCYELFAEFEEIVSGHFTLSQKNEMINQLEVIFKKLLKLQQPLG